MKKLIPILLFFFELIFFQKVSAHVILVYPVGGENFLVGQVVEIQWEIAIYHGPCNWDLYFSSDGGFTWESLAHDLPETQLSYNWTIQSLQTDSGRIKVTQDNITWHANYSDSSEIFTISISSGIKHGKSLIEDYTLYPAYPNPFNPTTTIEYAIPERANVQLTVTNLVGEEVAVLINQTMDAGSYRVEFNATSAKGVLPSGIYFYRITAGEFTASQKMILIK